MQLETEEYMTIERVNGVRERAGKFRSPVPIQLTYRESSMRRNEKKSHDREYLDVLSSFGYRGS